MAKSSYMLSSLALWFMFWVAGVCFYKAKIETDLTFRTGQSLRDQSLWITSIRFSGRDGFISLKEGSESIVAEIENLARQVFGVRVIETRVAQSQKVIERSPPQVRVIQEDDTKLIQDITNSIQDTMFGFQFNSTMLRAESAGFKDPIAQKIQTLLQRRPNAKIRIQGHTCSKGSSAYNQKLSLKRAQAVKDFLVRSGISADHLVVEGMGEEQPKYDNSTREGRRLNRRVEFKIEGF